MIAISHPWKNTSGSRWCEYGSLYTGCGRRDNTGMRYVVVLVLLALSGTAQAHENAANKDACKHLLNTGAQPAGDVKCDLNRDKPTGSLLPLGGSNPVHVYREQGAHQARYVGDQTAPSKPDSN
jgi:hypothetical protein